MVEGVRLKVKGERKAESIEHRVYSFYLYVRARVKSPPDPERRNKE
jgi:hypothetical protein